MINDTEKRESWYESADKWEVDFVNKYGGKFGIVINPSKETIPYAPDLYIIKSFISADLKVLRKPFYKAIDVYGIPSQHCWTFNPSDLFEYSIKFPDDFGIFIWKSFEDSNEYSIQIDKEESIYYTTMYDLKRIIKKSGKVHHYIRRMNDTNGNSYGSYGIDLRKLYKLEL